MKVTAIIPTYNSAFYIRESINSVLNQTYKNIEIIVVDDESTDDTEKILADYITRKELLLIKKRNGGPASARNAGVKQAKGAYIAFLDADDQWENTKIEKQLSLATKKDFDIVHTGRQIIGAGISPNDPPTKKHNTRNLIRSNYIINSSVLVKTRILKENPIDENSKLFAVEDYDLWLNLMFKKYKFGYIPEKLVKYRLHPNQISSTKNISNLLYLYKKNIKATGNYFFKLLLIMRYVKILVYRIKLPKK